MTRSEVAGLIALMIPVWQPEARESYLLDASQRKNTYGVLNNGHIKLAYRGQQFRHQYQQYSHL